MKSAMAMTVLVMSLIGAAPAIASDEASRPKPACSAAVLGDKRGDVRNEGLDLVGIFLTDSLGDSFANIVVANLDGIVEQDEANQEYFRLQYVDDLGRTQTRWARLESSGQREGATWFDGVDGIVQIRLPSLTPGTPTSIAVQTGGERELIERRVEVTKDVYLDVALRPFPSVADELEAGTPSAKCPAKPPVVTPPPPPREDRKASSPVTAGTPRLRGRTLRVPLRSSSRVTNVTGRLTRNGRVVARGRLAELDGRGTLVLTARRAFRAGTYVLSIPGVLERRVRIS